MAGILLAGLLPFSCKKSTPAQNVNNNCVYSNSSGMQFTYTILSGSSQFFPLNNIGGSVYISGAGYGYKGILVYRVNQNQFVAFERACTHDGCNNAKSIVWVQTGNTACKDSVCGSMYNLSDGSIQQGPATIPLYKYSAAWNGNELVISN